ncbi:unnamed protein product [Pieris brassicae]|uniref:Uncharacterized protein n=1 Tax=Pieris brassicae TaxID=7116 RepID=A0A9P0XCY1_PIEBR|nr:unnamed protein product [Pieris brassicae]
MARRPEPASAESLGDLHLREPTASRRRTSRSFPFGRYISTLRLALGGRGRGDVAPNASRNRQTVRARRHRRVRLANAPSNGLQDSRAPPLRAESVDRLVPRACIRSVSVVSSIAAPAAEFSRELGGGPAQSLPSRGLGHSRPILSTAGRPSPSRRPRFVVPRGSPSARRSASVAQNFAHEGRPASY